MANNFDSNFTRQLARVFLEKFESSRVLSKNVDTQLLQGRFNPASGENVDFKRPTDFISVRTPEGDVSLIAPSDILTGKATGTVQPYFTAFVDYNEADEAIKMDQLDQLLDPLATRIKTDLELDFAKFMMDNAGLLSGTYGTPVTSWDHIAEAGAVMESHGIPMDNLWMYAINPFTQRQLATEQRSLGAGGVAGGLIKSAHDRAIITDNFAGMRVMTATTLNSVTTGAEADRSGTLSATPDATYLTAKDTMTQVLAVTGIGAGATELFAGEVIRITAAVGSADRFNLNTRRRILDETGAAIVWTATITQDVILTAGAGNIVVAGPALSETLGQYNTVSQPLLIGDVIDVLGAASTTFQPNMFWHKKAFSIGSVPIKKLKATDTLATTEDGLMFRVTQDSQFLENVNQVRFDFRPAYATLNPFFAGQSFA